MGTRIKTFVSTGIAPGGRLFAGDLNSIEDQYADLNNLAQTLGVGVIQIGEAGLQLLRYGPGEARLSGAFRTDGILRALGGVYAGAFTTTQRDAIAAGSRPYGLVILNTTNNRLEINTGSDTTPSWTALGATIASGTLATRSGATSANANSWYFATDDNGGTLYYSTGAVWTKVSRGLTEIISASMVADGSLPFTKLSGSIADAQVAAGSISPSKIVGTAVITSDARLSDTRTPTDNTVSTAKIQAGAVSAAKIGSDVPVIPIGGVIEWPWVSSSIPAWSVLPYGQLLTQAAYPAMQALADASARPYGGSAGVNFNTPDYRGRVAVGKDDMGGTAANRITVAVSGVSGATLGAVFGAEGITLTTGQLPAHNHGVTGTPGISDPTHSHNVITENQSTGGSLNYVAHGDGGNGAINSSGYATWPSATGISLSVGSLSTANAGSGSAHQNTQPSIIVNRIMRVL